MATISPALIRRSRPWRATTSMSADAVDPDEVVARDDVPGGLLSHGHWVPSRIAVASCRCRSSRVESSVATAIRVSVARASRTRRPKSGVDGGKLRDAQDRRHVEAGPDELDQDDAHAEPDQDSGHDRRRELDQDQPDRLAIRQSEDLEAGGLGPAAGRSERNRQDDVSRPYTTTAAAPLTIPSDTADDGGCIADGRLGRCLADNGQARQVARRPPGRSPATGPAPGPARTSARGRSPASAG